MNVFTRYVPAEADLLRLWVRGWEKRGWVPRLVQDEKPSGPVCSTRLINFGLRRPRKRVANFRLWTVRYGARGWDKAPLVLFPVGTTEEFVLSCGRTI